MMIEFDFKNEARNLKMVLTNMAKSHYAKNDYVPEPMIDLCSKNLLVIEYLSETNWLSPSKGKWLLFWEGTYKWPGGCAWQNNGHCLSQRMS